MHFSLWIVAARLALVLLGSWAVWFAFSSGAASPPPATSLSCPMHPDVKSSVAGDCPICGMALEPVAPGRMIGVDREASGALESAGGPLGGVGIKPVTGHVFSQAVEAPAWVDDAQVVRALLYNDELSGLATEKELVVMIDQPAPARLPVVRTSEPASAWDEATSLVSLRFESERGSPATGSVGRLLLPARRRDSLVVPQGAILAQNDGPYVLVRSSASGGFEKRPVTLGKSQYDMTAITAGLGAHEPVVFRSAFLLDVERRFRAPSAHMP